MGILETEVWVGLSYMSIEHFKRLNYKLPKNKNDDGKCNSIKETKLLVKVTDLMSGSNVKVTKICDICNKKLPNRTYASILTCRNKNDGKDRCGECGIKYANFLKKENVVYEKTFEYHAKIKNMDFLLREFSDKNEKNPNQISHGSHTKYWWICPLFGKEHEYDMKIGNRTIKGCGCPYCSKQRINKTNCLWATHPDVAKLLKYPEVGFNITSGRNKKEFFKCFNCQFDVGERNVCSVVANGLSCPKCGDGISYPEKFVFCILKQLGVEFEIQKKFKWSCGKRYDFYIRSKDCIIETHGLQHYNLRFEKLSKKSLSGEKENDNLKKKLSKSNGVKKYNVINSKISSLYDLSKINWLLCHEYAINSLVKDVCDLWMAGHRDMRTISEKTKLGFSTVAKYIRQGTILGWCDYNPEDGIKKSSRYPDRSVVRLSLDGIYIEDYKNISSANKLLDISVGAISSACKSGSQSKSAGGFRWMYKEDYEIYKYEILPYKRKFNNKPVVRLTLEGKYIDEFESATKACEKLGIHSGHFSSVCRGRRKTIGGFRWMFKKDYETLLKTGG